MRGTVQCSQFPLLLCWARRPRSSLTHALALFLAPCFLRTTRLPTTIDADEPVVLPVRDEEAERAEGLAAAGVWVRRAGQSRGQRSEIVKRRRRADQLGSSRVGVASGSEGQASGRWPRKEQGRGHAGGSRDDRVTRGDPDPDPDPDQGESRDEVEGVGAAAAACSDHVATRTAAEQASELHPSAPLGRTRLVPSLLPVSAATRSRPKGSERGESDDETQTSSRRPFARHSDSESRYRHERAERGGAGTPQLSTRPSAPPKGRSEAGDVTDPTQRSRGERAARARHCAWRRRWRALDTQVEAEQAPARRSGRTRRALGPLAPTTRRVMTGGEKGEMERKRGKTLTSHTVCSECVCEASVCGGQRMWG